MKIRSFVLPERKVRMLLLSLFWAILIAVSTLHIKAQAPDFRWVKTAGGYNDFGGDQPTATAVDANGNVCVVGIFYSKTPVFVESGLTNTFSDGWFIAKYDSEGKLLWAKSTGTNAGFSAVATDPQGNIYAGGYIRYSNTFGNITLTNDVTDGTALLVKYDATGNVLWATQALNAIYSRVAAISLDTTGNPFITGDYYTTSNIVIGNQVLTNGGSYVPGQTHTYDVFVAKFTSTGLSQWARQAAGLDLDSGSMLAADRSGNVFFGTPFPSYADFGGIKLLGIGQQDFCLAKYGSNGDLLWAKRAATGSFGYAEQVATDPSGNVYFSSFFNSATASFDNVTITNVGGQQEIVLAKYDGDGNFLWVRPGTPSGGSNKSGGLCVDSLGNSYLTGVFVSTNLAFGELAVPRGPTSGASVFVVKHDSEGNLLWMKTPVDADAGCNGIGTDGLGNVYIAGGLFRDLLTTRGRVADFGGFTVTNDFPSAVFVARLDGPKLSINPIGSQITISWPTNAAGLHLESSISLGGPWSMLTNAVVVNGNQKTVAVETSSVGQFFRLNGP